MECRWTPSHDHKDLPLIDFCRRHDSLPNLRLVASVSKRAQNQTAKLEFSCGPFTHLSVKRIRSTGAFYFETLSERSRYHFPLHNKVVCCTVASLARGVPSANLCHASTPLARPFLGVAAAHYFQTTVTHERWHALPRRMDLSCCSFPLGSRRSSRARRPYSRRLHSLSSRCHAFTNSQCWWCSHRPVFRQRLHFREQIIWAPVGFDVLVIGSSMKSVGTWAPPNVSQLQFKKLKRLPKEVGDNWRTDSL